MKRQICTLALLGLLLVVGGIFMVAGRTPVSETERRQLAQWPQLTWQSLYTGRWMQDAEQAAADQFPCRDLFRQGKAQFVYHVLLQGKTTEFISRGGSAIKAGLSLKRSLRLPPGPGDPGHSKHISEGYPSALLLQHRS